MSGFGQTDPVRKQAGVRESSGPFPAIASQPMWIGSGMFTGVSLRKSSPWIGRVGVQFQLTPPPPTPAFKLTSHPSCPPGYTRCPSTFLPPFANQIKIKNNFFNRVVVTSKYWPQVPSACAGGIKREIIYVSSHCHHQNDSCVKMGSDGSLFSVSLIVRDKVTRQCPQTTCFWRERRAEAYQPNA